MYESIASAVGEVAESVAAAARRSGRDPSAVRIVAAVKSVSVDRIRAAVDAGITDLGENRAQDLASKAELLSPELAWHYLGTIQTNKVRYLDRACLVHGLDRPREAEALQSRGHGWEVLIEVNVAGEPQKQGIQPEGIDALLELLSAYPLVRPRGFMFVAPQAQNPEDVRWIFARGRQLGERYESHGLSELSMGMSDDYEVAIEEGATIVRIGRAIFGPRGT
jgi:hypothetical protein